MARALVRRLGLAAGIAISTVAGCSSPDADTDSSAAVDAPLVVGGRWQGEAIERHPDFIRYRFVAPGEQAVVVEVGKRRPEHTVEYGTDELVVQPAPGNVASPELLLAVSEWLRAGAPGMEPMPERREAKPESSTDDRIRAGGGVLLGLGVIYLIGTSWRRRREQPATATDPSRRDWATALAIALLVFVVRVSLAAPTPLQDDALEDVATALAEGTPYGSAGADASFGALKHGISFPGLLGLLCTLGLEQRGAQLVVIGAFALAFAVVYLAGRRLVGHPSGGLLAVGFFWALSFAELIETGEILWGPSIVALPIALVHACSLRGAGSGRAGPFVCAGLFAGLAADAHVAGLALWPALAIVAVATARDDARRLPAWAVVPTLALAAAVPMLLSPYAVQWNASKLVELLGWPLIVLGVVATFALGLGLRWCVKRWLGQTSAHWRVSALALAVPLLSWAAARAAAGFVEDFPARYFAPVFPALALALAGLTSVALGRMQARGRALGVALVLTLIGAATVPAYVRRMAEERGRWNYLDLAALGEFARAHGIDRSNVHLAIRGALCGDAVTGDRGQRFDELLIGGLRMLELQDPPTLDDPPREPPSYLVLKRRRDELCLASEPSCPDGRHRLPEAAITLDADPAYTIVLIPIEPLAELDHLRLCVRSEQDGGCVDATLEPMVIGARQVIPSHPSVSVSGEVTALYYELPLHGPRSDRSGRTVLLLRSPVDAWSFVGVEGRASVEPQPPAMQIELTLAPGAAATVTIAANRPEDVLAHVWWPPVIELPDDPLVRELIGAQPTSSSK